MVLEGSRRRPLIALAALLALHAVGIRWMEHSGAMESILSPGPHSRFIPLFATMLFMTVRIGLVLLGPGLVLVALVRWGLARRTPPV